MLHRKRADMRRASSPSASTVATLYARAGRRCELCGGPLSGLAGWSKHHRRPRGMGGTRVSWVNDVTNLLLLCGSGTTGCHGRVESHREAAYEAGWLLRSGEHPAEVPVLIHARGVVYLTPDGDYQEGSP